MVLAYAETISIHILHTKDDKDGSYYSMTDQISIHILHTKDDTTEVIDVGLYFYFNPHPSYEG